jgi:hypothetical protein
MLCGFDEDLAGQITQTSNRIRGLLTQIHPALERVLGPRLEHPAVLALLERYPTPAQLTALSERQLATPPRQARAAHGQHLGCGNRPGAGGADGRGPGDAGRAHCPAAVSAATGGAARSAGGRRQSDRASRAGAPSSSGPDEHARGRRQDRCGFQLSNRQRSRLQTDRPSEGYPTPVGDSSAASLPSAKPRLSFKR